MAIDPYEPELAKRKTALQIAYKQLNATLSSAQIGPATEFRQRLTKVFESMEDYRQAGEALAQWLEQHQEQRVE